MPNCINAINVNLLNALELSDPIRKIIPNVKIKIAMAIMIYKDTFLLLIAQVMIFLWLLCLMEQLSWMLLFC
jgi:hypothetical protein